MSRPASHMRLSLLAQSLSTSWLQYVCVQITLCVPRIEQHIYRYTRHRRGFK